MTSINYPPGPPSRMPLGYDHAIKLFRDPLGFLQKLAKYGDITHYRVNSFDVFLLNHPDYIREVLVTQQRKFAKGWGIRVLKYLVGEGLLTSDGDFHLRQRRLAQPAFHKERIAAYASIMTEYTLQRQQSWRDGTILDMAEEMRHLTLAIVTKTLFDANVEVENPKLGKALNTLHKWTERVLLPVPLVKLLEKLPLPTTLRSHRALAYLDATLYQMIKDRRSNMEDRGDLLSMLLATRDEEDTSPATGTRGMTDQQVRDEVVTFFLAGHETTALALMWTWYLLSQHPKVEAKLHEELERVLGGRNPTMADLPKLCYTEMVLSEALRLYPPAYVMLRTVMSDYSVGGFTIPAKSLVIISPYLMHRDPRYFPNPSEFNPERWTPQARAARPKFSYFPFGGGPRVCIGESFAWMEAILILATLAQRWKLELVANHPVQLEPLITLRSRHGLKMRLLQR